MRAPYNCLLAFAFSLTLMDPLTWHRSQRTFSSSISPTIRCGLVGYNTCVIALSSPLGDGRRPEFDPQRRTPNSFESLFFVRLVLLKGV
ncbi:uncharacterized protein BDZ99DRAFT_464792 [Mytilinidion resinicola]|uniref:Secreted protein n=1 Tax=Mytilinidion resinicola TaxID=574789 RepID=A0A6A6YGG0_9PEZI|nr:uncharacterized protein BDZ99DRAFT_464792 [Mytilinidion resinicola]KAF2807891.1 hypothetical protein BDZ99DRAFT_464792 [Mytilinidion resinicola]